MNNNIRPKKFPISRRLNENGITALEIFKKLRKKSEKVFLLESADDKENLGRYTFLGYDPTTEIICKYGKTKIIKGSEIREYPNRADEYIREILEENKGIQVNSLPPFTGGLVGYFSYQFMKTGDLDLMLFNKIIAIDHLEEKIILIVNVDIDNIEKDYNQAMSQLDTLEKLINEGEEIKKEKGQLLEPLKPLFTKKEYMEKVEKAKHCILEGDIFQVVLSNQLEGKYRGTLLDMYEKLRRSNPSPYMFYITKNNLEIAGASPETLIKLKGEKLLTFPLAGTRPRGKNEEEDTLIEKELLNDEKECAEHNMLVDLGRNDIGKVSKFGTVKVEKYMEVEKFSYVMHIGSTVSGIIEAGKDGLDGINAILPAGTLSGAPKIRACQIIDQLENNERDIYGGGIGYIDFNGNVDTCIGIRLAYKKNEKVYVRAGAGIVADSVPEKEYEECINKAKAVINALEGK